MSMKKALPFLIVAALTGLIIAGCHKSSGSGSTALTMTNLVGSYKLTASTSTYGGISYNTYDSIPACEKDDVVKLNPDSTYNYIDAGTSCSPNGSYSGNWFLKADSIYIDANGFLVKSFTGTTLILNTTDTLYGIAIPSSETLTKQ